MYVRLAGTVFLVFGLFLALRYVFEINIIQQDPLLVGAIAVMVSLLAVLLGSIYIGFLASSIIFAGFAGIVTTQSFVLAIFLIIISMSASISATFLARNIYNAKFWEAFYLHNIAVAVMYLIVSAVQY